MAVSSLLILIDDISVVLDDVAMMTKVASQKAAGVLGDDLALNAQQVAGIRAEREIPVVWAVAKGSLRNKVILVPGALAVSALAPWAVTPLLMCGGAFLCLEGFEKLAHPLLHPPQEDASRHQELVQALSDEQIDMVAFERDKISGAVRTDFILSAEIVAITLGTVTTAPLVQQLMVLSGVAALVTVGVYGLVGAIVKLDDLGLYLSQLPAERALGRLRHRLGLALLSAAPQLMRTLSVLGTAAMFTVGGGILLHGLPFGHGLTHGAEQAMAGWSGVGSALGVVAPMLVEALAGVVAGGLCLVLVSALARLGARFRR